MFRAFAKLACVVFLLAASTGVAEDKKEGAPASQLLKSDKSGVGA